MAQVQGGVPKVKSAGYMAAACGTIVGCSKRDWSTLLLGLKQANEALGKEGHEHVTLRIAVRIQAIIGQSADGSQQLSKASCFALSGPELFLRMPCEVSPVTHHTMMDGVLFFLYVSIHNYLDINSVTVPPPLTAVTKRTRRKFSLLTHLTADTRRRPSPTVPPRRAAPWCPWARQTTRISSRGPPSPSCRWLRPPRREWACAPSLTPSLPASRCVNVCFSRLVLSTHHQTATRQTQARHASCPTHPSMPRCISGRWS